MSEQIEDNKRRAAAMLGGLAVLVTVMVWAPAALAGRGVVGLLAGAAVGAVAVRIAVMRSTQVALARIGAQPADPLAHARFHNLVEGLCVAAGLPKPALYVAVDDRPAALAVGRDPRHAAVVVTSGLLDGLSRIELEGVLAHELSHIKSYDIRVATLAVTVLAIPLQVFRSLLPKVLRVALGDRREIAADVTGVALTRYPPGLISALEKLRERPAEQAAPPATAHLWCTTYPPLDERIQALREL